MGLGCFFGGVAQFVGRIVYSPPYWEDLRVPATSTNQGAANAPNFSQWLDDGVGGNPVYAWHFAANIDEVLFFEAQLPHSWVQGSTIRPHVHWSPINANVGNVVWSLSYTWSTINGVYPNTVGIQATQASTAVANTHQVLALPNIALPGAQISTMLTCAISRLGTDAADTLSGDVVLHETDFHYQVNSPGSRQEFVK